MLSDMYIFKSLGEETKHKILKVLLDGELCACEIPEKINRTQSNTSMHLTKLADLGILQSRRQGKMVIYSIKDPRVYKIFRSINSTRETPDKSRRGDKKGSYG